MPLTEAIWRHIGSRRPCKRCKTWQVAPGRIGFERMPPVGVCSGSSGVRGSTQTGPSTSWSRRSVQISTVHGPSGSRKAHRRLPQRAVAAEAASPLHRPAVLPPAVLQSRLGVVQQREPSVLPSQWPVLSQKLLNQKQEAMLHVANGVWRGAVVLCGGQQSKDGTAMPSEPKRPGYRRHAASTDCRLG